jgi:hypothetical protein
MRVLKTLPAIAGAFALALSGLAGTASANAPDHVVGYLYVNDNTAPANTIAGFARHADGSLTALPGSPFAAGGAGLGAGLASQGALELAGDGRYLLAVDAGSNQISVLQINPNGSLHQIPDGLQSSGGNEPVSIAVHGHLVYVANSGATDEDYTGFWLTGNGHLLPISGSTVALPDSATPGDILFNPTGTKLVGVEVGPALIDSFTVGSDGRLTAAPGSPFTAQGPGPFGSAFSPVAPDQLFVSNAHGGTGNGTVSAFHDSAGGVLSSIGASPFADDQTAPCWVSLSANGRVLYAVNTGSTSISTYWIAPNGSLTLAGSTPVNNASGIKDATLSPDQHTFYVLDSGSNAVSAFHADGVDLTPLTNSPTSLPVGATAAGIAVR